MGKVKEKCAACGGEGVIKHTPRSIEDGEVVDGADLRNFKILDLCEACGGAGKRMVEVT